MLEKSGVDAADNSGTCARPFFWQRAARVMKEGYDLFKQGFLELKGGRWYPFNTSDVLVQQLFEQPKRCVTLGSHTALSASADTHASNRYDLRARQLTSAPVLLPQVIGRLARAW